jgi:hypothetical protein
LDGYYGHLSVKQEQTLADLKALLEKDGIAISSLDDEAKGERSHGVSDLELLSVLHLDAVEPSSPC